MSLPRVQIITDGSGTAAFPNGGWATIIRFQQKRGVTERIITGHVPGKVTNIVMEMTAVIEGLSALTRACDVTLVTDLSMIRGGICTWMGNWVKRGWRKSDGKPVENVELWKQILLLTQIHHIEVDLVKGHSGVEQNERVDKLAGKARMGELTNTVRFIEGASL